MKFLVDECCELELVHHMRDAGFDVLYISESMPASTDKEILERSYLDKRIIITEDKDFGELVFRLKLKAYGIILLRFSVEDRQLKWERLERLIGIKGSTLSDKFIVIDKDKIRLLNLTQ